MLQIKVMSSAEQLLSLAATASLSPQRSAALQSLMLSRMSANLKRVYQQVQANASVQGATTRVDAALLRQFVKDATLLSNHLLAVVNSNIECEQVGSLFKSEKDQAKFCTMLRNKDQQQKCQIVEGKCKSM
jgi:hypothetical protein